MNGMARLKIEKPSSSTIGDATIIKKKKGSVWQHEFRKCGEIDVRIFRAAANILLRQAQRHTQRTSRSQILPTFPE